MNKKIIFLIALFVLAQPLTTLAVNGPAEMADGVKTVAMAIALALVVVGWVVAGILYLTAGGAPEKMGTAKKALIASIIGTVLIVIAELGYEGIKTFLDPIIGGGD